MLAHTAYLDTLQTLRDSTAEWQETLAGLVVLRLVDAWLSEPVLVVKDTVGLQVVQEALSNLSSQSSVRESLCAITTIVAQSAHSHIRIVAPQLFKYSLTLQFAGLWTLAEDVSGSILEFSQAARESVLLIQAARQLSLTLRNQGKLLESEEASAIGVREAYRTNNIEWYLKCRNSVAKTRIARGLLDQAKHLLDMIGDEAKTYGLPMVMTHTLQDLAHLATVRREYHTAITLCKAALTTTVDPIDRTRSLCDMGAALVELGDAHGAKRVLVPACADTPESVIRQAGLVNLLAVSVLEKDKQAFDRYRQELTGTSLPPHIQASYHLQLGAGYQRFDQYRAAIEETHTAVAVASIHGLSSICARAQAQLETLL